MREGCLGDNIDCHTLGSARVQALLSYTVRRLLWADDGARPGPQSWAVADLHVWCFGISQSCIPVWPIFLPFLLSQVPDLHRVFRSVLTYSVSLASLLPLYPPQVFSLINLPECLIPSWPLLLRQSKNSPAKDFLMAFFLTQNESHSPRGRSQGLVTCWCLSCWSQLLQLHTCSLCSDCTGCVAIS